MDGIGDVMADEYLAFFADEKNKKNIEDILEFVEFEEAETDDVPQDLAGMTFVITGSLNNYQNRDELKNEIQSRGGKVAGSVSSNTNYLINNDITSGSGKNKKAKELGVPIITEDEYREM